jgi:glycerol-3-phosphate acyltransferase PlsX
LEDTTSQGNPSTIIAVDAMGGDNAPDEIVKGAVEASKSDQVSIILVGEPEIVNRTLNQYDTDGANIHVVPSSGVIEESDQPAIALKKNPKASVAVTVGLVQKGKAHAAVSMGSTGALMASSFFGLGMIEGVDRPVLGGPFLGYAPNMLCLDVGVNVDARPSQYLNFAAIGTALSRSYVGINNPTVGLLNIGVEPTKGSKQAKEAYENLTNSNFNFIGNIEAHEMVAGKANIVLCDGFVGNVLLKFSEGLAEIIRRDLVTTLSGKLTKDEASIISKDVFNKITIPDSSSGAPILGVKGVSVVGHGRAKADMVRGVIKTAKDFHEKHIIKAIEEELKRT